MTTKKGTQANDAPAAPGTGLSTVRSNEKSTSLPAAIQKTMMDRAGEGFEDAGREAYTIPFIRVLQDLSPQVKKNEAEYIKGAEPGMLFNTATQKVFDGSEGILIVPVHFRRTMLKWAPRKKGGGFLGEFAVDSPEVAAAFSKGPKLFEDESCDPDTSNEFMDTRLHYVLQLDGDDVYPAVLSMASTGIKRSKEWMMRMQNIKVETADGRRVQAPMYAKAWQVTTVIERKDQNSWYAMKFEPTFWVDAEALLNSIDDFRSAVRGGQVREKFEDISPARETDLEGQAERVEEEY